MLNRKYISKLLLFCIILSYSCASPINRTTRFKKVPREYSLNYCGDNVKGPNTDYNKEAWIVFSSKEGNYTLQNPGGVVKYKKTKFMESFFVIKEKGEYLCLVKYDPQLNGNDLTRTKIKNRDNAQYYGWMNKADLLLSRQSVTDIATGFKTKSLSIISDTMAIAHADIFIKNDSIQTFKDDKLSIEGNKIPLHELIYTVKYSDDRKKKLMATKATISPDSVDNEVLGWVPAYLTYDIGQRLHINTDKMPSHLLSFKTKEQSDLLPVSQDNMGYIHTTYRENALKYAPVHQYRNSSDMVSFKASLPMPLTRRSSYYVLNVDGEKISFNQFKKWEKDLRKINIIFVLEGKKLVIDSYNKVLNAVQNLQPMFDTENDMYEYKFGAVMAFQGQSPVSPLIKKLDLTDSYFDLIHFMNEEEDNMHNYKPLSSRNTWSTLETAANLIYPSHNDETNIIIIIGEAGSVYNEDDANSYSEEMRQSLMDKIADANARVLGFQLFGEKTNAGNNFVLQVSSLIDNYAYRTMYTKREKIVYTDQLVSQNKFKERSKNIYSLDFPANSMTQGWILFPQKDADQPLNSLITSIDTLIIDVKKDNDCILNNLDRAFKELGKYRTQLDSVWIDYHNVNMPDKKSMVDAKYPMWYLPSQTTIFDNTINEEIDYKLLLSDNEFKDLMDFLQRISANEVDYTYKGKKKEAKDICNCPDDYIIDESEIVVGNAEFMNTKKIRNSLYDLYSSLLNECRICTPDNNVQKNYTLADIQLKITGCPSSTPQLNKYILNDIKDRKKIPDGELQQLILYFKDKKENLENLLATKKLYKFESNGENYYWISQDLLP